MQVTRHRLEAGEDLSVGPGCDVEMFLHPLIGIGEVNGLRFGGRKNVFHAFPGGLLLSPPFVVKAVTRLDLLVASHPSQRATLREVSFIEHDIGKGTLRRSVREVLGADGPSKHIRCGETINEIGGWSSWPPHSFDKNPENAAKFEEVFYVFTDPKDGYAIIRKNGKLEELRSGDRTEVPLGEHPIVAGPGVRMMYVWFYVSPVDKHYAKWAEDLGGYA